MSFYGVNILVSQKKKDETKNQEKVHIVEEKQPSEKRLLGWMEEGKTPSYRRLKPGSLLQASGGWLLLPATKASVNSIFKFLKTSTISISIPETQHFSYIPFSGVKMLFTINSTLGNTTSEESDIEEEDELEEEQEEWQKILGSISDFSPDYNSHFPINKENVRLFCKVIREIALNKDLLPFDKSSIKRLVEHFVRLGEGTDIYMRSLTFKEYLTLADSICYLEGSKLVTKQHVDKAIQLRVNQTDRYYEEQMRDILNGRTSILTSGRTIGQNNSLCVVGNFGNAVKATATVAPGKQGVINVQKESGQAGESLKITLPTISGFIKSRYCLYEILGIDATIASEQTYSIVDGDSGAISDTCVILSALSELPLTQDISVTGSMNQYGEAQSVGKATEKVEAWFDICNRRGLTGTQGVIIPSVNKNDLMLNDSVLQAVKENKFKIYHIEHVDEAMEILTGVKAGKRIGKEDNFEEGTINFLVEQKLMNYSVLEREYNKS